MNEQNKTHNLPVWSDEKLKSSVKQYRVSEKAVYKIHVIKSRSVDQFRLKTFSSQCQAKTKLETTSVFFIIHIYVENIIHIGFKY